LLVRLSQQQGVFASSAQNETAMLISHPYKTTMAHEVYGTDQEARMNFFSKTVQQFTSFF
jgi:hypothetical protein